jgi:hypothetical protein
MGVRAMVEWCGAGSAAMEGCKIRFGLPRGRGYGGI